MLSTWLDTDISPAMCRRVQGEQVLCLLPLRWLSHGISPRSLTHRLDATPGPGRHVYLPQGLPWAALTALYFAPDGSLNLGYTATPPASPPPQ